MMLPTADLKRDKDKDKEVIQIVFGFFNKLKKFLLCHKNYKIPIGSMGFKSIMAKSIHFTHNARYREVLMEIANQCKENTITNFVNNIDDIKILFQSITPAVHEFFEDGFIETGFTTNVKNAEWQKERTLEVFEGNSVIISENKANKKLAKQKESAFKKRKI